MHTRLPCLVPAVIMLLVLPPTSARAEVTSISGYVQVVVREFIADDPGDSDYASDLYPDTGRQLPLQVVARLIDEGEEPAAASVAAQFADPLLSQPNPEEFAVNLALLSVSPDIRYTGQATTRETRGIVFTAGEFPGQPPAQPVLAVGRLSVDGALAIFSPTAGRNLAGANVYLRITVVKIVEGRASETVFSGRIGLEGTADGSLAQIAEGDFPTSTLLRSDLAVFVEDFDVFEVLIIPDIAIDFDYSATLGQPFTLEVTLTVEAANAEDEVGVAAVVGTPVDAIREVIAAARGEAVAAKMITALAAERANPTGRPAFPTQPSRPLLWPLCGLFGFEFVLGLGALVGLRCSRPRCRRGLLK